MTIATAHENNVATDVIEQDLKVATANEDQDAAYQAASVVEQDLNSRVLSTARVSYSLWVGLFFLFPTSKTHRLIRESAAQSLRLD